MATPTGMVQKAPISKARLTRRKVSPALRKSRQIIAAVEMRELADGVVDTVADKQDDGHGEKPAKPAAQAV